MPLPANESLNKRAQDSVHAAPATSNASNVPEQAIANSATKPQQNSHVSNTSNIAPKTIPRSTQPAVSSADVGSGTASSPAGGLAAHGNNVMRAEPTKYGQAYSERNPPPNIQAFHQQEEKRQEASRKYFDEKQGQKAADTPKQALDEDGEAKAGATDDVPIGAEKTNVLFQPAPTVNFDQVFETLHQASMQVAYVVAFTVVLLDWLFIGGGFKGLLKSLFPASGVAAAVYFVLNSAGRKAADEAIIPSDPKTEKLKYVPESVEVCSMTLSIWHIQEK